MNYNRLFWFTRVRGAATALSILFLWLSFGLSTSLQAASLPAVPAVMTCSDLLKVDFTGSDEAPFRLLSATLVSQNVPQPYCDVVGYVPSQVKFEVRLPTEGWTQRFVMAGCG